MEKTKPFLANHQMNLKTKHRKSQEIKKKVMESKTTMVRRMRTRTNRTQTPTKKIL